MTRPPGVVLLLAAAAALLGAGPPAAREVTVEIHAGDGLDVRGWYAPAAVTVRKGTVVRWVNRDLRPHSVTSAAGRFDSGLIKPGAAWTRRFDAEGEYPYECYRCFCNPMTGRVVATR